MILLLAVLAQATVLGKSPSPVRVVPPLPPYQCTGTGCVSRPIASKEGDVVSVCDFIGATCPSGGDDTAAIQAARDYANGATGKTTVVFPPGTYNYSASPNWAIKGVRVRGLGTVTLNFTGTGNAWSVDFGSPPSAAVNQNVIMENLTISGNASATNGLYVSGCDHCAFRDIRVTNVSAAGVAVIRNTVSLYENIRVSSVEGAFTTTPVNGILIDQNANSQQTSACTFTQTVVEGVSGSGIKINTSGGFQNVFKGGTSETNARGIEVLSGSGRNTFIGLDLEGNSVEDITVTANDNSFIGMLAISSVANATHILSPGHGNTFTGGLYGAITLDAGAYGNSFIGLEYRFGSGAFTDSGGAGNNTLRLGLYNNATSANEVLTSPNTSSDTNGAWTFSSTKNNGTCTLNAGTPATCTATVLSGARCVAVPTGTTAAAATHTLATSVTTTTLTVTGANGLSDAVTYHCF